MVTDLARTGRRTNGCVQCIEQQAGDRHRTDTAWNGCDGAGTAHSRIEIDIPDNSIATRFVGDTVDPDVDDSRALADPIAAYCLRAPDGRNQYLRPRGTAQAGRGCASERSSPCSVHAATVERLVYPRCSSARRSARVRRRDRAGRCGSKSGFRAGCRGRLHQAPSRGAPR